MSRPSHQQPPSATRRESTPPNSVFDRRNVLLAVFAALVAVGAIVYSRLEFNLPAAGSSNVLQNTAHKAPFEVVDLPGRGKGLIATRDIQQGELLIREEPLVLVPETVQSPEQLLLDIVYALSPSKRDAFFELAYDPVHLDPNAPAAVLERGRPLAIFQTNAVAAGEAVGLFPRMARLNHGCSGAFNAVYSWRQDEHVLVVHALKPIPKGQELLTTYTDTKRSRDERRSYLKTHYGFECSCPVCSLHPPLSSASDRRLQSMSDLYGRFATWGSASISGRDAIDIARQIWAVGEEEGYWSERGRLAADAAWVAASHHDHDAASAWAGISAEWYGYELGRDSTHAREMTALAANPRAHAAWASRAAMIVGGPSGR